MSSDMYSWLMPVWHNLNKQLSMQRLPHGMLWISPQGLGTQEFAMKFLQRLMCANPTDEGACGICNHCQLFIAGTHPDFHHLTLEEKSKDIKIEQIRKLTSKLVERPYQGGKRLVFLEPADRLNRAAANAFLKTLQRQNEISEDMFLLTK